MQDDFTAAEWAEYLRGRLMTLAQTPFGVSFCDINRRIASKRRTAAREVFAQMLASGDLHSVHGPRWSETLFTTRSAADAWVAAGKPKRPMSEKLGRPPGSPQLRKPAIKRHGLTSIHEHQPSSHWRRAAHPAPGAIVGPCNLDERFTVRELPDGYKSALNSAECRGWARAVAGSKP